VVDLNWIILQLGWVYVIIMIMISNINGMYKIMMFIYTTFSKSSSFLKCVQ